MSSRQQFLINLNKLDVPFSSCKVLPSVGPPEWERTASEQGMIGAKLGSQMESVPTVGCIGPGKEKKNKDDNIHKERSVCKKKQS